MAANKTDAPDNNLDVGQLPDDDEPLYALKPIPLTQVIVEEILEELEPIGDDEDSAEEPYMQFEITVEESEQIAKPDNEPDTSKASEPAPNDIPSQKHEPTSGPEDVTDANSGPPPAPTIRWELPPAEKTLPLGTPATSFSKGGTKRFDAKESKLRVPVAEQITLDDIDNLIVRGEIRGLDPETDEGSRNALKKLKDDIVGRLSNVVAAALGKPTKPGA